MVELISQKVLFEHFWVPSAFLCTWFECMGMLYSRWRVKALPALCLLPVDAITLMPQMWPQGWHAWLSRWWLPLRQRAWPVLAHSVTPTVPTYRQLDAKRQRHICHLPPLWTFGTCSDLRNDKREGTQLFESSRSEIRFATLKLNHITKNTVELSDPASAV